LPISRSSCSAFWATPDRLLDVVAAHARRHIDEVKALVQVFELAEGVEAAPRRLPLPGKSLAREDRERRLKGRDRLVVVLRPITRLAAAVGASQDILEMSPLLREGFAIEYEQNCF
jgi:hypothetical protein